MQKKNISLLGIAGISFIFFIISAFAFGFKPKGSGLKIDLDDLKNAASFGKDTYGLMVAGLVFISIAIILAGILVWLSMPKTSVDNKDKVVKWMQISIFGIILLSTILVLAGESLFLNKSLPSGGKLGDYWDAGIAAGMLIFTLIPLPLLVIPFFIK